MQVGINVAKNADEVLDKYHQLGLKVMVSVLPFLQCSVIPSELDPVSFTTEVFKHSPFTSVPSNHSMDRMDSDSFHYAKLHKNPAIRQVVTIFAFFVSLLQLLIMSMKFSLYTRSSYLY